MRSLRAGVVVLGLSLGGSALAGVVVLKNGNVLVGELDPGEVTSEALVVRQPAGAAGAIRVPREQVRWYDLHADEPTADYWREFPTAPIDGVWEHTRPRPNPGPGVELPPPPPITEASGGLQALPVGDRYVQLRGPEGWSWTRERGVTMWVSERAGPSGFRPRIHVFSVETPPGAYGDQVGWIQAELAKLADAGGYEVEQAYQLRELEGGGADQRLVTSTLVAGQPIAAMRQVSFRARRTYFFAAYAHRDDYQRYHRLFQAALKSLRLLGEE